jgi:hypothetical protein
MNPISPSALPSRDTVIRFALPAADDVTGRAAVNDADDDSHFHTDASSVEEQRSRGAHNKLIESADGPSNRRSHDSEIPNYNSPIRDYDGPDVASISENSQEDVPRVDRYQPEVESEEETEQSDEELEQSVESLERSYEEAQRSDEELDRSSNVSDPRCGDSDLGSQGSDLNGENTDSRALESPAESVILDEALLKEIRTRRGEPGARPPAESEPESEPAPPEPEPEAVLPPEPPAAEPPTTFDDIKLDDVSVDDPSKIDMSCGGTSKSGSGIGLASIGGWGAGWGSSTSASWGGLDDGSKDADAGNPWDSSDKKKKKDSNGFDFDFNALKSPPVKGVPAVDPFAGLSNSQKEKLQKKIKDDAKLQEEDARRKEEEDAAELKRQEEAEAERIDDDDQLEDLSSIAEESDRGTETRSDADYNALKNEIDRLASKILDSSDITQSLRSAIREVGREIQVEVKAGFDMYAETAVEARVEKGMRDRLGKSGFQPNQVEALLSAEDRIRIGPAPPPPPPPLPDERHSALPPIDPFPVERQDPLPPNPEGRREYAFVVRERARSPHPFSGSPAPPFTRWSTRPDVRGQLPQPIYPKLHRSHLDLETLLYYDIPYEIADDPDWVLVLREMSDMELEVLFEHTRRLRENLPTYQDLQARRKGTASSSARQVEVEVGFVPIPLGMLVL